ncbi:MAG: DUF2892 domain-containing protein [Gammaproteobacteria bacterium]|nr:DUF2892 domain-containing protein [Gammaproteobacteria bacterium]
MKIPRNIGKLDALLRTIISLLMIYFGFFSTLLIEDQLAGTILGVFGALSLLVVMAGHCPFYTIIDFSSVNSDNNSKLEE